jgi:hypothetical protein
MPTVLVALRAGRVAGRLHKETASGATLPNVT